MSRAMEEPRDPVAAATHADPYPYYARLTAEHPFQRDAALGLWVAAGAAEVTAILEDPRLRVRPPTEPVPAALAGTALGRWFALLARQTDGPPHARLKPPLRTAFAALDGTAAAASARHAAAALAADLELARHPERLDAFALRLPVQGVGGLFGLPALGLRRVAEWVGTLVRGLAAQAPAAEVHAAGAAAEQLQELCAALLPVDDAAPGPLLAALAQSASALPPEALLANAVALLTQAYEATAGLFGNSLRALAERPELSAAASGEAASLLPIVREVARFDPPVQNTRRFAAEDVPLAGQTVRAGEAVLVLLAAANRDPAVNPGPARFDPARARPVSFTFGRGAHACPGEALACTLAAAGVAEVLRVLPDWRARAAGARFRPSPNARVPLFAAPHPSSGAD